MSYDGIFYSEVAVLIVILIVFLLLFLGGAVLYVIRGIALSTIASRMGKELPWLAWIPLARTYLHGDLAGSITLKKRTITQPGIWLLVLPLAAAVIYFIWYLVFIFTTMISLFWSPDFIVSPDYLPTGTIMTMIFSFVLLIIGMMAFQGVFYVLKVLVNNKIFGQFTTSNMAIAHSVLSILIPMYETICLFVMRNKEFYTEGDSNVNGNPHPSQTWGQPEYGGHENYQVPASTQSVTPSASPASAEIPTSTQSVTSSVPSTSAEIPTSTPSVTPPVSPASPELPPSRSSVTGEDWR